MEITRKDCLDPIDFIGIWILDHVYRAEPQYLQVITTHYQTCRQVAALHP